MNVRGRRVLAIVATAALAVTVPVATAEALGTERGAGHTLSVADAPYYLDVHDSIPASFRRLDADEVGEYAETDVSPDSAVAAYLSESTGSVLVANLTVGKGPSARVAFEYALQHAGETYNSDELVTLLADADLPAESISVETTEWMDVAVGDAARSTLFHLHMADEGTFHFEVLVMMVRTGNDAALVEVAHGFVLAPSFAVADIASVIEARVKSGPPTPERTIAEAGLVAIGDLPAGWAERTEGSGDPPTASTGTQQADENDLGEVGNIAKSIPACKTFVALLEASNGGRAQDAGSAPGEVVLEGPKFALGPASAASEVTVYPTTSRATQFFHLLRAPTIRACLTKLYAKATTEGLDAAAKNSTKRGATIGKVRVEVTTPRPSPAGDDRLLFRVSVRLPSMGNVRVVTEQEYVRTGRAVASYIFSDVGRVSIREDVVRAVSERLAAAPGVR
jgi:hypothetical protein